MSLEYFCIRTEKLYMLIRRLSKPSILWYRNDPIQMRRILRISFGLVARKLQCLAEKSSS